MVRKMGSRTAVLAFVAAIGIAGCQSKSPPPAVAPAPPPAPTPVAAPPAPAPISLTRKQRIANALIALNNGQVAAARVGIVDMLAQTPGDPVASDLLRQIDTDPKVLLGERSFAYEIHRHETLSMIAHRFLGNSNRFWALARYNNIAVPSSAGAGQVIQVPGTAPVRAAPRIVKPAPSDSASAPATATPERGPGGSPTAADIASANRLRGAGLDEMARGSIDKAVGLLERASALNPQDGAIQGDLARARKIQATLRH
ncbi:LysM peptidoglycan-binding domain-containing protein [Polymorphobacter sp. PAMC 29334]|uniref:LysM peptidoglycan-binding domain-containing protein n=1 Tax=Polymorphobacter sp. PAMC 29334 TaxID=2862331 RepID=UPI001C6703FB|nr:LysM domain-containing protein [Polymorphobacter sp. PAMC 29334]QYE35388.1 LysM peptidoglycan-binding domain-containing protein [Polymorphobacter sp. PAMC 29334]